MPVRRARSIDVLEPMLRQLPPSRSARHAALLAAKRLTERWTVLSYSQRGEDLVLDSLLTRLGDVEQTYVDVGSNHPVRQSNTYRLYLRGWRGVLIDANAELVSMCERLRPRDRAVCAVISDRAGQRHFRFPRETRLAGFVRVDEVGNHADVVVEPRTLTDVLSEVGFPERFGVLCIDCEGSDDEVVRSLDFSRFRPRVIVCEQPQPDLQSVVDDPLVATLVREGYRAAAFDGMNVYYVEAA